MPPTTSRADFQEGVRKFASALIVTIIMIGLYRALSGPNLYDWVSYQKLFIHDGAWLSQQSRDPLFLYILRTGYSIFGFDGYDHFRLAIFTIFLLSIGYITTVSSQRGLSSIYTIAAILSIFLMKTLVQIREGMAFFVFVFAMWPMINNKAMRFWPRFALSLCAVALHAGLIVMVVVSLGAYVLSRWFLGAMNGRNFYAWATMTGVILSLLGVAFVGRFSGALIPYFEFFQYDNSKIMEFGWKQQIFWLLSGASVYILRRECLLASRDAPAVSYGFFLVLTCVAIPTLYFLNLYLVFSNVYIPGAQSIFERTFFTCSECALLSLALRRKLNVYTFAVSMLYLYSHIKMVFGGIT